LAALFQPSRRGFAKPFLFICQHFSWPAINKTALFYGFILSVSGVAFILNDYSGQPANGAWHHNKARHGDAFFVAALLPLQGRACWLR